MNDDMSSGCQKRTIATGVDSRISFAGFPNDQRLVECSVGRGVIRETFGDIHQRVFIACPLDAEVLLVEGVCRPDSTNQANGLVDVHVKSIWNDINTCVG